MLATNNNSQTHYTKGRPSPHKGAPTDLLADDFSYYFTPLTGVLFTFPSRYSSLSVDIVYLALRSGLRFIHTGFHVSGATLGTSRADRVFGYGVFTLCDASFKRFA